MSKNAVFLDISSLGNDVKMPTVEFSPKACRVPPSKLSIKSVMEYT